MADELPSDDQILRDLAAPAFPPDDQILKDLNQPEPVAPPVAPIQPADETKPVVPETVAPEPQNIPKSIPEAPLPAETETPEVTQAREKYKGQLQSEIKDLQANDTSGKRTVVDLADMNPNELVPFLSGIHTAVNYTQLYQAAKRLQSGESQPVDTNTDYQLVKDYLAQQKESQKPESFGYKFWNTVLHLPAFAVELIATAGTFKVGKAVAQEALLKAAEKMVQGAAEKKAVQIGAKALGTVAGAAVQTAAARAPDIGGGLIQRLTPSVDFTPDEAGKVKAIVQDPNDGFMKAMAKSFGNEFVEVFTEHTGGAIGAALSKIPGAQKLSLLKEAVLAKWFGKQKGTTSEILAKLQKIKRDAAWDGLLSEMGEEQLGDILKPALGITDGYQQHLQSATDLAAEAAAFAVPGMAGHAVAKGVGAYEGVGRGFRKSALEAERQSPERRQSILARGQEIERQGLTDDIMRSGAARPGEAVAPAEPAVASEEMPPVVPPADIAQPSPAPAEPTVTAPPTPAQAEAGNYAKRKLTFHGLPISIENEKGSTRSGTDAEGKPWSVTMPTAYGYFRKTSGADDDHLDVYVGPNLNSPHVFVVDQKDHETHKFDETKTMVGFDSLPEALAAYQAAFSDGKGGQRIKGVASMSVDEFKDWLKNGNQKKPVEAAVKDYRQGNWRKSYDETDDHIRKSEILRAIATMKSTSEELADVLSRADSIDSPVLRSSIYWAVAHNRSASKEVAARAKKAYDKSVQPEAAKEESQPAPVQPVAKKEFRVITPPAPGRKSVVAHGMWDVIDASAVGDLGGITDLQSRNRYGASSKQQIADIASKLDPRLLGDSATVMDGAPVVDETGDRIAGYGRLASIKAAYDSDNAPSKTYRKFVQQSAAALGLGKKADSMKQPILVRRALQFEGGDRAEFADLSNADPGLEYTPAELARNDAKLILSNNLLAIFKIDQHGNIGRAFKDAFFNGIKQKSGLRSGDGGYLPAMDARIQTAILTALLEKANNDRLTFLVRAAVERAPALGIMPQINGLIESAPRLLDLGATHPDFDLAVPLARALLDFVEFRRRVQNGYLKKISEFMDQLDLFEEGRSAESGIILEQLGALKSVNAVAEFFTRYATEAEKEAKASQTMDMFSGQTDRRSSADLLGKARNETANVGQDGGGLGQTEATNADAASPAQGSQGKASDYIPSQGTEPGQAVTVEVYHGTSKKGLTELKPGYQGTFGAGIYFGSKNTKRSVAGRYGKQGEVLPAKVTFSKLFDLRSSILTAEEANAMMDQVWQDTRAGQWFADQAQRADEARPKPFTGSVKAMDFYNVLHRFASRINNESGTAQRAGTTLQYLLKQRGYDGIAWPSDSYGGLQPESKDIGYVAFDQKQVEVGAKPGLTDNSNPGSLPSDENASSGRQPVDTGGLPGPSGTDQGTDLSRSDTGWSEVQPGESQADNSLTPIIGFARGKASVVLKYIGANSKDRFYRQLAKLLAKFDLKTTVEIQELSQLAKADPELAKPGLHGLYSPSANKIVLVDGIVNQEKIFMHEAVHAVSVRALREKGSEFGQAIDALLKLARDAGVEGYGMTSPLEFVAEAFSSPTFQESLKGVRVPASTLWRRFTDLVRRLLGLKEKFSNALIHVVEVSVENMKPDSELAPVESTGEVHPSLAPDTKTAQAALATAGTRSPAAVETEARGISGQVTFLRRKIEQHTPSGEDNIISAALHKIGYDEILGTADLVDGLVDPEELAQGLERLKENPLRATYAKEAGMRFKLAKSKMQEVIEEYEKFLAEVSSDEFQERMQEKVAEAAELAWFQLAQTYFDADVSRLLAQLKTLAETESRQQGRAEGVYGQMKDNVNMAEPGINGLKVGAYGQLKINMAKAGYSEAVKATIASIVSTFAKHEDALAFLYSAVPADVQRIIDTYNRLKPEGQPDPMIVKWAAEILTRAKEITRNILAIESVKQNEKVRRHYDTLVTTIFDEWKKSPGKTSKKIVKAVSTFATDAEKARAAYAAIHREFAKTAKNMDVLETAATIARSVLEDEETKAYEKMAYSAGRLQERGGGAFLDQDPDSLRLHEGIALPDGSVTGPIILEGDVTTFANTFAAMRSAAEKIQTWLEENPDKVEGEYWRAMLEHLDNVLLTSRVWSPAKVRAPLRQPGPWGMLKYFADDLGTREGGRLKVAIDNFKRSEDLAKGMYFENNSRLTNAMTAAAKSHGYAGKTRYSQWYDQFGRELLDSWQNPEGGLERGSKIKGMAVTAEDMALVRMMAQLSSQGFDIVQRGILRGREGVVSPVWFKTDLGATGVKMHVQSTTVTKNTVPRTFNPEALRFVDSWMRSDPQGKLKLLNDFFSNVVMSYLRDRSNTFFDGLSPHEEAYKAIANEIDENGLADSDRNMHWLVGKVAEIESLNEGETEEEQHARITADILQEFDKQNERVHNYYEREDKDVSIETLEQRSSFTKSRGQKLAGYWLYNTGWKDSNAFANFAHAIHGYYYTRAAEALNRVKEDLLRQKGDLDAKMRRIAIREKMPLDKAQDKAVAEQALRVEAGKSFDDYRELERKMLNLSSIVKDFASIYGDEGKDSSLQFGKLRRFFNATGLSVLVSELTALRNVGYGWVKQGRMLNKYQGTIMAGYPKAFYQMWLRTMVPLMGSAVVSVAKVSTVGLARGVRNAYQGVGGLERGPAAAFGRFLEPMLTELSQRMFERMRLNREMFERGVVNRNYAADDFIAKLQNLQEGGVIRETPLYTSALGNMGSGLLTIYDAMVLTTVGRPLFPRAADIALNHSGVVAAFDSLDRLEKQLRVVHRVWTAAGRTFDGSTPLDAKEVFGGWYAGARTANDLVHLIHWFEHGRIGYQEAALRFLKKLSKGDNEAEFLSEEEKWQLAEAFVEELNKGESTNRPLQLKKGGLWDIVAPLQGWNVAELRTFIKHFSRAVDPKTSKALLWMSLGMLFVAPALAAGAFGDVFNEWMARLLYKYLRGEERATRQPWERDGNRSQAIGWAISIANPIPFVQTVVNTMLNDMPNRASSDPIVFLQSKAMDMAHYAGGVVQTGDMTYGLPRLVKSFLPLSSVFINRLDGTAGSLEALDARRLMTRYGPQEMLKPQSANQANTATELTPYGEKMLNAAMQGKDSQFLSIYNQAVEKARALGMANPEKTVRQMYASRNPYDRAFKQKLDPEQRQSFLSKLNPDERMLVDDVESRFSHAAGLINAPANFERAPAAAQGGIAGIPQGSIAGSVAGGGRVSGAGAVTSRAPKRVGRSRGLSGGGQRIKGIGARKLRGPGLSRGKGLRAFR